MDQRTTKRLGIIIGTIFIVVLIPFLISLLFGDKFKAPKRDINITMWNLFDDGDLYKGVIEEFEARDPRVSISYTKKKDINELETDLVNELAEGKGPDIVAISPSWVKKHGAKFSFEPKGFEFSDPKVFKDTFAPFTADDLIVTDDKGSLAVIAIPTSVETLGVIYNKSYFLQNLSSAKPSDTWDTFVEDVMKGTKRNSKNTLIRKTPIALGRVDNIRRGTDIINLLMLQNGVNFYDPTGRIVTIDSPALSSGQKTYPGINSLDYYSSFGKSGEETYVWSLDQTKQYEKDDELGAFVRGEIGMIFGYPYLLKDIERLITQYTDDGVATISLEDVGVAEVPQLTKDTKLKSTLALYYPLAVPNLSKNKDKAWAFIEFMASEEVQRYLFKQNKKISSRINLISEQSKDETVGAFASSVGYAKSLFIPDETALKTVYNEVLTAMQSNKMDSTDGITKVKDVWQCSLKKIVPTALDSDSGC